MNNLFCPDCGANLIEDYSEEINFLPNDGIVLDAFPALVCSKNCGFYQKL